MSIQKTELYYMLRDKTHSKWRQKTWCNQQHFISKDSIAYQLISFSFNYRWVKGQSALFEENKWKCYIPIGTYELETDMHIGYIWDKTNMANWLLSNDKEYTNLHWCDVGNHPYPSEVRRTHSYLQDEFNRYANKLIFPHHDITKAVIFPSELCPSTPL